MIWLKRINFICFLIISLQTVINLFFFLQKGDFILDYFFNILLMVVSAIALITSFYLLYKGENNIRIARRKKEVPADPNILDDSM